MALLFVHQIVLNCVRDSTTTYSLRVMWFLNGVPIDDAGEQSNFITTNQGGQQLLITSAVNAVRGNYTCHLSNIAGSDEATSVISDCSSN